MRWDGNKGLSHRGDPVYNLLRFDKTRVCQATTAYSKQITTHPLSHYPDTWPSMNSRNSRPWRNGKYGGATFVDAVLTGTLVEAGEHSSDSSTVHKSEAKPVEIIAQRDIHSVAFLGDGKYIVSCDDDGKI